MVRDRLRNRGGGSSGSSAEPSGTEQESEDRDRDRERLEERLTNTTSTTLSEDSTQTQSSSEDPDDDAINVGSGAGGFGAENTSETSGSASSGSETTTTVGESAAGFADDETQADTGSQQDSDSPDPEGDVATGASDFGRDGVTQRQGDELSGGAGDFGGEATDSTQRSSGDVATGGSDFGRDGVSRMQGDEVSGGAGEGGADAVSETGESRTQTETETDPLERDQGIFDDGRTDQQRTSTTDQVAMGGAGAFGTAVGEVPDRPDVSRDDLDIAAAAGASEGAGAFGSESTGVDFEAFREDVAEEGTFAVESEDFDGVETQTGRLAQQARELEQEVLERYPSLDEGDVGVVSTQTSGGLTLEARLTEEARRDLRRDDIRQFVANTTEAGRDDIESVELTGDGPRLEFSDAFRREQAVDQFVEESFATEDDVTAQITEDGQVSVSLTQEARAERAVDTVSDRTGIPESEISAETTDEGIRVSISEDAREERAIASVSDRTGIPESEISAEPTDEGIRVSISEEVREERVRQQVADERGLPEAFVETEATADGVQVEIDREAEGIRGRGLDDEDAVIPAGLAGTSEVSSEFGPQSGRVITPQAVARRAGEQLPEGFERGEEFRVVETDDGALRAQLTAEGQQRLAEDRAEEQIAAEYGLDEDEVFVDAEQRSSEELLQSRQRARQSETTDRVQTLDLEISRGTRERILEAQVAAQNEDISREDVQAYKDTETGEFGVRRVDDGEEFGNFELGIPGTDRTVEGVTEGAGILLQRAASDVGDITGDIVAAPGRAVTSDASAPGTDESLAGAFGVESEFERSAEASDRTADVAISSGVGRGANPFFLARGIDETLEFAAYSGQEIRAGRGGELARDTEEAAIERGTAAVESARENPLQTAAILGGSLLLTGGAIRAASSVGPRTAAATRFAVQPGEEILTGAATRVAGLTARGQRALSRLPGNRLGPEEVGTAAAVRARAGARARARRVSEVVRGESSVSPTPRQAELVDRFRPGSRTDTFSEGDARTETTEASESRSELSSELESTDEVFVVPPDGSARIAGEGRSARVPTAGERSSGTLGDGVLNADVSGSASSFDRVDVDQRQFSRGSVSRETDAVAGARSEPLGSDTSDILDATVGTGQPGPRRFESETESESSFTGESETGENLPLREEIQEAGGARPFARGEDLPPRVPGSARTQSVRSLLRGERGQVQLSRSRSRRRSNTGTETETDVTEPSVRPGEIQSDIQDVTLRQRREVSGDIESRSDPIGEATEPSIARSRVTRSEVEQTTTPIRADAGLAELVDDAETSSVRSALRSGSGAEERLEAAQRSEATQAAQAPQTLVEDLSLPQLGSGSRSRFDALADIGSRGRVGAFSRTAQRVDTRSEQRLQAAQETDVTPEASPEGSGEARGGAAPTPATPRVPFRTGSRPALPDSESERRADETESGLFPGEASAADGSLGTGWLSETVATIATRGTRTTEAPSEAVLEDQPESAFLTGELPTALEVSGDEETQEAIDDVESLLSFGTTGGSNR